MRRNAHKAGFRPVAFHRYEGRRSRQGPAAARGRLGRDPGVVINGSDVWYRVRVGPSTISRASKARVSASRSGRFNYMLVKVKPGRGAG